MSILNMANLKKIILFLILNIIILSNSHAEWEKFLSIEERNLNIFLDRHEALKFAIKNNIFVIAI